MYKIRISQIVNGKMEVQEALIGAESSRDAFLLCVGMVKDKSNNVRIHVVREEV